MKSRRLEVLLPADVSAHDYAAVSHAIWAVLNAAGLDEDGALRADKELNEDDADLWPQDDR
ncbi:hypothetical protein [Saccharothrix stipae]